jgi:hypothetical protein
MNQMDWWINVTYANELVKVLRTKRWVEEVDASTFGHSTGTVSNDVQWRPPVLNVIARCVCVTLPEKTGPLPLTWRGMVDDVEDSNKELQLVTGELGIYVQGKSLGLFPEVLWILACNVVGNNDRHVHITNAGRQYEVHVRLPVWRI